MPTRMQIGRVIRMIIFRRLVTCCISAVLPSHGAPGNNALLLDHQLKQNIKPWQTRLASYHESFLCSLNLVTCQLPIRSYTVTILVPQLSVPILSFTLV